MKKVFFVCLFLQCIVMFGFSQSDKTLLKVRYEVLYDGKKYDDMELLVGEKISKFYSLAKVREQHELDSVNKCSGGSYVAVKHLLDAKRNNGDRYKGQEYVVYKHLPSDEMLTFVTKFVFDYYTYHEPISFDWNLCELTDSVIAGYHCQKAVLHHRGQVWNAWFSPEISISDGPWKLCGLPGLILKAQTSNGLYSFECSEIHPDSHENFHVDRVKSIKVSPKEVEKMESVNPVLYWHQSKGIPLPKNIKIPKEIKIPIESYEY